MKQISNVITAFLEQCERTPKHIAFSQDDRQISYQQFEQLTKKVAGYLTGSNQCIAIAMDRGIDAAIAIYGILRSGNSYLPLDINNPANRLNFIIADAQPVYIIGIGPCPDNINIDSLETQWIDLRDLLISDFSYRPVQIKTDAIAAILYTSGSTGTPKGVALSHKAITNFATWAGTTFNISQSDHIASLAPFHFDLSIFDLFTSLSCGATVSFIPNRLTLSPSKLTQWLCDNKITTWYTVPSLLSFIALKGSLESRSLNDLKQILFAGEVFPTPQLIKLAALLPNVNLYNLYGPTETNVCCYWPVITKQLQADKSIPIGIPACNAVLTIDKTTNELLVESDNNFSGYWQNGKLNTVTFKPQGYATGDKVSINAKHEYCYHGRLDRMLKCSGYRVEPAEIESIINQLEGIETSVVIGLKDITSGQRPAAAVVIKKGHTLTTIIKPLRQKLPAYMFPCKFTELSAIPLLSNGKVDYLSIEKKLTH